MYLGGRSYHQRLARAHRAFEIVRLRMITLIMAVVLGFVGTVSLGIVTLHRVDESARTRLVFAQAILYSQLVDYRPHHEALELAIGHATEMLEKVRTAGVTASIVSDLEFALLDAQTGMYEADEMASAARELNDSVTVLSGQWWVTPDRRNELIHLVTVQPTPPLSHLVNLVSTIGTKIELSQRALDAWNAEQERAAAEKAAADAAGTPTRTRPITPAAPTGAAATPVSGFNAEAYLRAIAPNSYVVWDSGVCARLFGAGTYLCGFASLNLASSASAPVPITLDSSLADRYANSVGIAVLVHEAAHARQWLKYGRAITTSWTTSTGLTGRDAIEYMADCATLVKLGYGTGTYIARGSQCSATDQAEAASYWR